MCFRSTPRIGERRQQRVAHRAHARGLSLGAGRRSSRHRSLQRRAASRCRSRAITIETRRDRTRSSATLPVLDVAGIGADDADERPSPRDRPRRRRPSAPHRRRRAGGRIEERRATGSSMRARSIARSTASTLSWREPASGIVARFAVEAGDDLEHWRGVGNGTVLVLEQQGARLERRDIALGGMRAKYLRLRRLDDGAAITGLAVEARSVEHGRAAPSRVWASHRRSAGRPMTPPPAGTTRFDYTLAAALPVDIARIELANDNALAEVTLLARASDASDRAVDARRRAHRVPPAPGRRAAAQRRHRRALASTPARIPHRIGRRRSPRRRS